MADVDAILAKAFESGVPRIGFGSGNLWPESDGRSVRLIQAAYDAGFRYFDTARLYGDGQAEHIVGEALAGRRDSVVIASKAGIIPWSMQTSARIAAKAGKFLGLNRVAAAREGAFSAKDIQQSVEASLRALRTDYLDILLLHECTLADVTSDETMRTVERLVQAGKVRTHGIATGFERTMQILKDGRVKPAIVQGPADAISRQADQYRAHSGQLVITHSAIRPVLDALKNDPQIGVRLRAAGIDPDATASFVALLVADAVASNPGGVVLASTLKPERLATLLAAPRIAAADIAQLARALRAPA